MSTEFNLNEFSNSNKSKQQLAERKKEPIKPVISGASRKKKGFLATTRDVFISDDAGSIGKYIIMDVLVPAIKQAISTIFKDGIDILLYGQNGNPNRKSSGVGRVSYSGFYKDRFTPETQKTETRFGYDELLYDTKQDAIEVLNTMDDILNAYGEASVADMYEASHATPEWTYNNYGWSKETTPTFLDQAAPIYRSGDKFIIKWPKARPISKRSRGE